MLSLGLPGTATLRRLIGAALCGAAFWAGTQVEQAALVSRCQEAGGLADPRGLCRGLDP